MRRQQLTSGSVNPNAAHLALAEFEQHHHGAFTLVTQNVDDLHQRAGSQRVLPMHGELLEARCTSCHRSQRWEIDITEQSACQHCGAVGAMRPDIVWFGEMPRYMDEIERALDSCEVFVSIGTSGVVYPAAGFQQWARQAGAHTVELNLEPGHTASLFDERVYGPATEVVAAYLKRL